MSKQIPIFAIISFKTLNLQNQIAAHAFHKPSLESTEFPKKKTLKNVGKLYKQFVFFVFAFTSIWDVTYKTLKFKSLILSYWQKWSAYTVII